MNTYLRAVPDPHDKLHNPFGPGGRFVENIRTDVDTLDDDELRESMETAGWLPGHPAIQDEHGVTIVGHRRLKIAAELGITPDILKIKFGTGDKADIDRLRTAWLSNVGGKPYSKADRKAMGVYLAERGWTQQSIARAMAVAQSTIARDLAIIHTPLSPEVTRQARAEGVRTHAPGAGRPRGTTRPAPPPAQQVEATPPPPMEHLSPEMEHRVQIDVQVWPLLDASKGQAEICRVTSLDRRAVRDSQERWIGGNMWRTVRQRMG